MVKFNPDQDIPSLTDRVIIVTGGTDGLGKETVLQLSKHNPAHIYLAARSQPKAEATIAEIQSKSPSACPITFLSLDLSSFASIKSAASTFLARETRLDILMCNAGIMGTRGTTKEGYDIIFGTNHVGHALLIKLLLPLMTETAKTHANADVRVVILGSDAESHAPKDTYLLKPEQIKSNMPTLNVLSRYGHSKIANVHYTLSLAKYYPESESGVKFVVIHPGAVSTHIGSELFAGWPRAEKVVRKVVGLLIGMVSVEEGAQNQLWAAVAPGVKNGEFYHPVGLEGKGSARSKDEKLAEQLWQWTEKELEGHVQ